MTYDPTASPFPHDKLEEITDKIERALEKCGVYIAQTSFVHDADEDGNPTGEPYFVIVSRIGSHAWSPRIQDPEQDKINDEFRGIESDAATQEFEEIRRRAKERRDRGLDPLDESGDEG